jgi:hypothetical protein
MEGNGKMSCPEFERFGLLYLSGELASSDRSAYEDHIRACSACRDELEKVRETWTLLEKVPSQRPSARVRKAVLQQARRKKVRKSPLVKMRSWLFDPGPSRPLAWGLSTAVVALIVVMMFIQPFGRQGEDMMPREELLAWEDDFIAEVDWLENEIDRVDSGSLLASYVTSQQDEIGTEEWLSPMSEDLDWIREKVEDLVKDIYGI